MLLTDVADKLKAPLRLCKPRDVLGPRFTELITCKKNTIVMCQRVWTSRETTPRHTNLLVALGGIVTHHQSAHEGL